MTPKKWESPEIAYYAGFKDGRDLERGGATHEIIKWVIFTAIVMFTGGLAFGILCG